METADRFLTTTSSRGLHAVRSLHLSWHINLAVYWARALPDASAEYIEWRTGFESRAKEAEAQWENAWWIISEMKSLDRLHVVIDVKAGLLYQVPEQALLEPLKKVQVQDFVVRLPWGWWPWGAMLDGEPNPGRFRIERPEVDESGTFT